MTHLFCIIDRSGSMTGLEHSTIEGYNEYLKSLSKEKDVRLTTVLFDHEIIVFNDSTPIKKSKRLTRDEYQPRGSTALIDAVCKTINENKSKVKKDDKALVLIITDGAENCSKEYNSKQLHDLVTKLEKKNWTFTYLGANQDAWAVTQAYGFKAGNVSTYVSTTTGTIKAFASMSVNTMNYVRNSGSNSGSFYVDDAESLKNA